MFKFIDRLLNQITMYRLVLYVLAGWLAAAVGMSFVRILPYDPWALLFTTGFLIAVSWAANTVFARTYKVPANVESVFISALILALVIDPLKGWGDLWFIGWAAVLAMASKYIVAWKGKHLFNPVAFAVALTAISVGQTASWWVGTAAMLPWVLTGGLLILRKVQRPALVNSFIIATLATSVLYGLVSGSSLITALGDSLLSSPLFFFAIIILTEPITMPPTRTLQIFYGALVGILFSPQVHLGSLYATPELAILIGNVFSWAVSPKTRLILRLKEKIQIAPDIVDFLFVPDRRFAFEPGQYMEWTLGHNDPDSRGNRRFFTLASSPTENVVRVGVKFYPESSTFKNSMWELDKRREIMASQLAGDFVLPENPRQPVVMIAGGIGITPFRSMIKYLLDTHQARPVTVFYSNRLANEIVYRDVFDRAVTELGINTVYTLTDPHRVPAGWWGKIGHFTPQMIKAEVPNYMDHIFYISGPNTMVDATKKMLRKMRVPERQIKTDYFSGLA
jgi:ferredoxin-NADP reductase/Na+-translocating ferredoxin:NAD+ oxidoreductase RnfD subunit